MATPELREKWRRYYHANRGHIRARQNGYYQKLNAEQRREKWRQAYAKKKKNPVTLSKMRERNKAWAEKNIELKRRLAREYQARNWPQIYTRFKTRRAIEKELRGVEWEKCASCNRFVTQHPTGVCKFCRKKSCVRCGKNFYQEWVGQRVHSRCVKQEVTIYD